MRNSLRRVLCVIAAIPVLASCTTVGATKKGAVGFNHVFADARNEQLLINILRAKYGEPQQFSTISTVTGNMRPEMKLTGGLDNLVLGAAKVFNPAGEFGFRNPSVTIAPLETKEFRQGMMKPISVDYVDQLLRDRWDPKVVFHLVLADIDCDGRTRPEDAASAFGESAQWQGVKDANSKDSVTSVAVSPADAAKMLREGAGDDVKLSIVESKRRDGPNTVRVQFAKSAEKMIQLGPTSNVCGSVTTASTTEIKAKDLALRSPAAMIQFLGTLIREKDGDPYFKVFRARNRIPDTALVGTRFRHNLYYVPHNDRSPETMALLAEIIGFQTTDASLNASKPTLTVPQN